jgi:aromatic-L-amino-acid decarboxylase
MPPHPLDAPRDTRERWLSAFSTFVLDHLARLSEAPASGPLGQDAERVAEQVSRPIGENPLVGGVDEAIQLLGQAAAASLNTAGPGYLAYIPSGGIFAAAVADLVSGSLNRYTGLAATAPALHRLERDVLSWLCSEFGYGPDARAVLTSGGSLANLGAVVAARHHHLGESGRFDRAVVYTSAQAHHSVAKAARLAGIPSTNVHSLEVDSEYRLRVDAFAAGVQDDRRRGMQPFMLVAAGGTTNTGAVDPLPALADFCQRESLWLHVDAAYGGAFVLCPEGRKRLSGIERADSISFDPHKGLFLPYGTGCLLVRDGRRLQAAHHLSGDYLQDLASSAGVSWCPAELGLELSRDYRGLRLWLPLMLHGAHAFRAALTEKLELAGRFVAGLERLRGQKLPIEIVARPQLSLTAFRLAPRPGEDLAERNRRNAAWLGAVNARQHVRLSSTLLPTSGGLAFTLRVCVLNFRTHAAQIDRCLEDLAETAA